MGNVVVLLGPPGAGKTTLCMQLLDKIEGSVWVSMSNILLSHLSPGFCPHLRMRGRGRKDPERPQ